MTNDDLIAQLRLAVVSHEVLQQAKPSLEQVFLNLLCPALPCPARPGPALPHDAVGSAL